MRHLENCLKVSYEGFGGFNKISQNCNFQQLNARFQQKGSTREPLKLGEQAWACPQNPCQSPNIFCFSSRRCCASKDRVAVGRANNRPTPIGSPVSSQ